MKKILFGLTLYTALLGGSFMLYSLLLPVRISFHVLALLALLAYLYKRGLPDSPLTIGAGLILGALLLSIPWAVDPRMALENGWSWLINLLILLAFIHVFREGLGPTVYRAHFVSGGVVAVFALVEFLISGARPGGLFDNINLTGAYAAALLLPTMNAYRESKAKTYLALSMLLALTVLASGNRGAVVSVGIASMVYVTLTWQASEVRKTALWCAALIMFAIPLWVMSEQPQHVTGDAVRLDLWRVAGDMTLNLPRGAGPGLFAQVYRVLGQSGENRFTGAHNHYLTLGAELGAVGLAAGAGALLIALYFLPTLSLSLSQRAALAALCGIAAHLMVDNYPSVNWAMLTALYAAHVFYEARLIPRGWALQLSSALTALTLLVWTMVLFQYDLAQVSYEKALNTGRYLDAYEASEMDPQNGLYQLERARLEGHDISGVDSNLPMYALTMYGRRFK